MKLVKYDLERNEVLIKYTKDEFDKEMSRASAFMNLHRGFEMEKKPDGQLPIPYPDLENILDSCTDDVQEENVVDKPMSPEDLEELQRQAVEKDRQETQRKKEEEKKKRKEEKRKRDEELERADPHYNFKTEGLKIINLLSSKWGKQLVDVDSDEFKIFRIKNKIKDIGYVTVILKKLYDRGFCELYFKGNVRPQISQFKLKF